MLYLRYLLGCLFSGQGLRVANFVFYMFHIVCWIVVLAFWVCCELVVVCCVLVFLWYFRVYAAGFDIWLLR